MPRKPGTTKLIIRIQKAMLSEVQDCFSEGAQACLRALVRVTIESYEVSQAGGWDALSVSDAEYLSRTILAGLEIFYSVEGAYEVLQDTVPSTMKLRRVPLGRIEEYFRKMCAEFIAETKFERRCRLLLDLTKLQLIWAVVFYSGGWNGENRKS